MIKTLHQDFTHMVDNPLNSLMGRTSAPEEKPEQKKKRKTRTPEEKLEALQKKQQQLAQQVKDQKAKLKGQARKEDTRRKIVAGAIALEHMEYDENFKHIMEGLLRQHVKESDLHLFNL